jgi:hypothetical protein
MRAAGQVNCFLLHELCCAVLFDETSVLRKAWCLIMPIHQAANYRYALDAISRETAAACMQQDRWGAVTAECMCCAVLCCVAQFDVLCTALHHTTVATQVLHKDVCIAAQCC